MTTGRAIIHNPTLPESLKRRQFLLDSLRKSGLDWREDIEENRIVITYQGQEQRARTSPVFRKTAPPPPIRLEKCLKSRFNCEPDQIEYWDEMILLSAERESMPVKRIQVRTKWQCEQWAETWAVPVSELLAVNRADGYWTITHILTGLAAGSTSNLKDAVTVAREVAHWPEWALLRGKDDITPEFRRKANEAFKAAAA
jgi:hypothetical protein